nr:hypothetical protein BaRGS_020147 [Batillaria attramentaria]
MMPPDVHATLVMALERSGSWQMYRIARQAMRYGQYSIAEFILSDMAYKAASTPGFPLEFQCEYVRLRVAWLAALRLMVLTCNTFRASPPPAIATALACSNGQEGTRWAQIVQQLEKCVGYCHEVGQQISTLYWASFDADPATLHNITLQSTQGERQFLGQAEPGLSEQSVQGALHAVSRELDVLLPENSTCPEKTFRLVDFLSKSALSLARASLSFPRFFFQTLQSTTVKNPEKTSVQLSQTVEPHNESLLENRTSHHTERKVIRRQHPEAPAR